jgi:hypothetical protein
LKLYDQADRSATFRDGAYNEAKAAKEKLAKPKP